MDLHQAKTRMYHYVMRNIPVALWGKPGIGKSEIVIELAGELPDTAAHVEALNLYESVDLRGLPRNDNGNVVWSVPEMFQKVNGLAARHARVILFLDEWNTAAQSVMVCAAQLIHTRRIGPHLLAGNVVIIAAGNEQSHRAAANRVPSMLDNRLAHLSVEPSVKVWRLWAEAKPGRVHPMVSAYVGFMEREGRHDVIHDMRDPNAHAWASSRSVARVSEVMDAPEEIRRDLVAGLVGPAWADSFETFVQTFSKVPKIADIIRAPDSCPVPSMEEPGLLYATSVTVSKAMTRANIEPLIAYLERMPSDYAMMAIYDATKRDSAKAGQVPADPTYQGLMKTAAFISWAARNQDAQEA